MDVKQRFSEAFPLVLAIALLLAAGVASVLWAGGATSAGERSAVAKLVAAPLSADQRMEHDRYLERRLGLGFGVPPNARSKAIARMREMKAAQSLSTAPAGTPASSSATGAKP